MQNLLNFQKMNLDKLANVMLWHCDYFDSTMLKIYL